MTLSWYGQTERAVRLRNVTIGLEAAHIKWHQAQGPDIEENGLALCATHHKLFDFGALSLRDDGTIILSRQLSGSGDFTDRVLKHHGTAVRVPQDPAHAPGNEYISWHQEQVFKAQREHYRRAIDFSRP